MKKNILLLLCWILFHPVTAQDTIVYKCWVSFTDKNGTPFETGSPQQFLSDRAIQRRIRYDIPVVESDLPVNPVYTDSIRKLGGNVLYTSKWFNAAVIETNDSLLIQLLNQQSFIDSTALLFRGIIPEEPVRKALSIPEEMNPFDYGLAIQQILIHHGEELHNEGYKGQDMIIAILDGGFKNVDSLPAFESLRLNGQILGTKDFVKAGNDVFREHDHGMKILSIVGGYIAGEFTGTAPKACFWLLRSEDVSTEYRIEEANWIAAAEFADSAGADVINSSLGYSVFDDYHQNYTYEDMDGNTAMVTRGADMAASKGMLVVNSAGNSGNNSWKYITAPADGDSVLAVGAVSPDGVYAPFSSQGPTFDERVKPNVVAIGYGTYIQQMDGTIGQGSGTSFSSPVMAGLASCLWQKFRELSNFEIIQVLQQSSSMNPWPDNYIGYGIPNLGVANDLITGRNSDISLSDLLIYPNPAGYNLFITLPFNPNDVLEWGIFDITGRMIRSSGGNISLTEAGLYIDSLEDMNPGLYMIRITSENMTVSGRFIKE
jgi:serine protease AprX